MGILIEPTLNCNLNCTYCYEHGKRDGNYDYDIEKVLATVDTLYNNENRNLVLHGGEPLYMGHDDMRIILKHMHKLAGKSGIQTNGVLIDDEYIKMFKEYKTYVSISIDGDYPLNKFRCNKDTTDTILKNIDRLREEEMPCGLLIMVHKANAGNDKLLTQLIDFVEKMDSKGISGRLNLIYSEKTFSECMLSADRAKTVYITLAKALTDKRIAYKWSPFKDIANNLMGKKDVVCIFNKCDKYHTNSALIILGDGTLTNCLKGPKYVRHPENLTVRHEILSKLSIKDGGCKECRYLYNCNGGCSNTTIDWRYRDYFCDVHYSLFEYFEKQIIAIGLEPIIGKKIEKDSNCHNKDGELQHGNQHGDQHGDHSDCNNKHNNRQHT